MATKEGRYALILEQLIKNGSVLVSDLVTTLDVSSVTIRKDLTELEKAGKLYRSHGRAIMINPFTNNRSVNEKEKLYPEEKHCIGREAARLITRDDSIIIASGTTVHALARNIHPDHRLTVVSASLQVSETLSANENIDIIQLGGLLRHSSLSVVGQYSEMILKSCSFSKLFLGVDGIDFEFGISTTDMREAELNQKMMKAAHKTIVLADSCKFGRRGFAKIADLEDIDLIITDSHVSPSIVKQIEELGIELIIAGPKPIV
jgi:DeoR/GlpR family transcriptional regulator of sugar metabolism